MDAQQEAYYDNDDDNFFPASMMTRFYNGERSKKTDSVTNERIKRSD